jgi:hypothetical protein
VIGREHDSAGRGDLVEARARELQPLDVSNDVVDLEAKVSGALPRSLDQDGSQVEPGHARARGASALGNGARATSKVKPAVARLRRQPLDDDLVDVGDCLGDPLVGPVAPHRALPLLELLEGHCNSLTRFTPRDGTGVLEPPNLWRLQHPRPSESWSPGRSARQAVGIQLSTADTLRTTFTIPS